MRVNVIIIILKLTKAGLEKSNYVKSLNESRISRRRKNLGDSVMSKSRVNKDSSVSKSECSIVSYGVNFKNETDKSKGNKTIKHSLRDLSEISQNSNFMIRNSIQNSIFNQNDILASEKLEDSDIEEDFNKNLVLDESFITRNNEEKQLGDIFFHVRMENKLMHYN